MNRLLQENRPVLVHDQRAWDELREALHALAARRPDRFKYVSNQGNAGDALIATGTWQFFDAIGLQPRYDTTRNVQAGDVVVYGGGGNLVPEYNNCQRFLERCLAVGVDSALVMPQTIRGHEALLARLDERFTLAVRDVASLRRARATGTRARLLFAPDMALFIDVGRLFMRCETYGGMRLWLRFAMRRRLLAYWGWRWALLRRAPPSHGHVNVMRVDVEATAAQPGDPRWDVSNLYGSKFTFREESDLVSRDFLNFFTRVSTVRTNRLHAGVAGALMGCDVTYLENSYGKIGAVYDAWLSHLPFVSFESPQGVRA